MGFLHVSPSLFFVAYELPFLYFAHFAVGLFYVLMDRYEFFDS